jgi:hypothetical protein
MSEERIRNLLTFAIIGGGPSGVEMSGELADFIQQVYNIKSCESYRFVYDPLPCVHCRAVHAEHAVHVETYAYRSKHFMILSPCNGVHGE